jgi:hypothetical protein
MNGVLDEAPSLRHATSYYPDILNHALRLRKEEFS